MTVRSASVRSGILAVVAGLIAAALQAVPWYRDVGLVEEWGVFSYFDTAGVVLWTPSDPQLASQAIRPLTVLPHSVGYWLTPDSFVGLQFVQASAFGLKAAAMVLLLRELRMRPGIVAAGAILFAVFPAHDGAFTLRAVHMHWSSALIVVAFWLLVVQARRGLSWSTSVAMVAAQAVSLLLYEAQYIIVALAPLLLLACSGLTWHRRIRLSLIWYLSAAVNGIRIVWLLQSEKPLYQEAITIRARRTSNEVIDLFPRVWRGVLSPVDAPRGHVTSVLAVVALVVLILVVAVVLRDREEAIEGGRWRYGQIAVVAFLLAPLTALVFYPSPSLLLDPLRIFAVAALPLTLAVCSLVAVGGQHWRPAEEVAAFALVALVLLAAEGERSYWHGRSDEQRRVLGTIVSATSRAPNPEGALIVLDPGARLGRDTYALPGPILMPALDFLRYGFNTSIPLCRGFNQPPAAGVTSTCKQTTAGISVDGAPPVTGAVVVQLEPKSSGLTGPAPDLGGLSVRERNLLPCIQERTCAAGRPFVVGTLFGP